MGGLSLGVSRKNIVEFSFLLALPTMAAATALDLYKEPPVLVGSDIMIWLTGLIVAFITAVLGIKFFLRFIQKNNFIPFGWYRIFIGLVIFAYLFL
jgi:undecaprenyl-diphosphatase